MKKRFFLPLLAALSVILTFTSCSDDSNEENTTRVDPSQVKRAVIVYAVNKSSLAYDFKDDSAEMLAAMQSVNSDYYKLLVFRTDSETECGLYSVEKDKNDNYGFELVRKYNRDVTSTHPDRIKEVIDYALDIYPNAAYDLIFWGHGMSWKPFFSDHKVDLPMLFGYGGEYGSNDYTTEWTEIDELADALPDHRFETIWFDCCYMTGIEVVYEFRDKCDTFVGYPTEVWQYGMSYDLVLPYLMREKPDVTGGARAFYDYYNRTKDPVTVAVIDMRNIEGLAEVSRNIIQSGDSRPVADGLLNYSRTASSPFYDFRQFMKETADANDASELVFDLDDALGRTVVYHAESSINFDKKAWDVSNISGLSTHYYRGTNTADESYYRTLDWFERVYKVSAQDDLDDRQP